MNYRIVSVGAILAFQACEKKGSETIRPKGSGYWGGATNCHYSIDNENGVAIVYFNQFLLFNDKEAYDRYRHGPSDYLESKTLRIFKR